MKYLALMALYIALVAYCVTDVVNYRDRNPHGLPKLLWVAIIILVPFLGGATWLFLGLGRGKRAQKRAPGPDDDPEYLRYLREQERKRKRDESA